MYQLFAFVKRLPLVETAYATNSCLSSPLHSSPVASLPPVERFRTVIFQFPSLESALSPIATNRYPYPPILPPSSRTPSPPPLALGERPCSATHRDFAPFHLSRHSRIANSQPRAYESSKTPLELAVTLSHLQAAAPQANSPAARGRCRPESHRMRN